MQICNTHLLQRDLVIHEAAESVSNGGSRRTGVNRDQAAYLNGEDPSGNESTSLYSDGDRDWRINFDLLHQQ